MCEFEQQIKAADVWLCLIEIVQFFLWAQDAEQPRVVIITSLQNIISVFKYPTKK